MAEIDYTERRAHERFEMKDKIFVTIHPDFERIGWVRDISRGGVSFEYTSIQDHLPLSEKVQVDIFSFPREFDLSNLSCRLVYDNMLQSQDGFTEGIKTWRCGLMFENISPHHAMQLKIAMRHCDSLKAAAPEQ